MRSETTFKAKDSKTGMDLDELATLIEEVKRRGEGRPTRVKATVGFKGQLQSLTFVEGV